MTRKANKSIEPLEDPDILGITRISVSGFKSIREKQAIETHPLTVLAGTNSSGKSSIMQPLLLLKQTLESSFDPGVLLLNGPNVKFTAANQLLSRVNSRDSVDTFDVAIADGFKTLSVSYTVQASGVFDIKRQTYGVTSDEYGEFNEATDSTYSLHPKMSREEISAVLRSVLPDKFHHKKAIEAKAQLERNRCFLRLWGAMPFEVLPEGGDVLLESDTFASVIQEIIHLPGLRGNPERNYPVASAGGINFVGVFPPYVASIIANWQDEKNQSHIEQLNEYLAWLGLSSRVVAKVIDSTQIEIRVGRVSKQGRTKTNDLVNIADVGLGMSQTLPVLVALLAAQAGQLVYIEQPEIHLHPRAQYGMATVLVDAAKRGVRVVVETHSALLLLGIQSLVAKGELPPEIVKLYWFERQKDGSTEVRGANLDDTGAFGDWPEDFADVTLEAESEYLAAIEAHYRKNGHGKNSHGENGHGK